MSRRHFPVLAIATALVAVVCQGRAASACTCVGGPEDTFENVRWLSDQADDVFLGEVIFAARTPQEPWELWALMKVHKLWKGVSGEEAWLITASSETACGVSFEEGVFYVVFGTRDEKEKTIRTNVCSGGGLALGRSLRESHELQKWQSDLLGAIVRHLGEPEIRVRGPFGA